jgi:tetratricopeptide (TPR) repeat protein
MPGRTTRSWRTPCGWFLVAIALLGMLFSAVREQATQRSPSLIAVLIDFVTDPLVVVGMPLGIYWIRRDKSRARIKGSGIAPLKPETSTTVPKITTVFVSVLKSSALIACCFVPFVGAFAMISAFLNSPNPPTAPPASVQQLTSQKTERRNTPDQGAESARIFYDRGVALNQKGDFDQAIAQLTEAIGVEPSNAAFRAARGYGLLNRFRLDEALNDLSLAIQYDPTIAEAYCNLGVVWFYKQDNDKAIRYLTEGIRLNPAIAVAYQFRSDAWMNKKQFNYAISDLSEAIRLDPKDFISYGKRGLAWSAWEVYDKAIADFDESIRLEPRNSTAYCPRGLAWESKKEYDRAIADYNEAIRLNPQDGMGYKSRGGAWGKKREYDKAIADFTEAIRLNPQDAMTYDSRGSAWQTKKQYDKAIADYNEAIRLDPRGAHQHFHLALVLFLMDRDGVVREVRTALDLDWPKDQSFYGALIGHFAARRTSLVGQAKAFLNEADARCVWTGWPNPLVEYLRNQIDEFNLLAAAIDNDSKTEAHCYLALDLLQKRRKEAALTHFRWVMQHGNPRSIEYTIASVELDRLEGK